MLIITNSLGISFDFHFNLCLLSKIKLARCWVRSDLLFFVCSIEKIWLVIVLRYKTQNFFKNGSYLLWGLITDFYLFLFCLFLSGWNVYIEILKWSLFSGVFNFFLGFSHIQSWMVPKDARSVAFDIFYWKGLVHLSRIAIFRYSIKRKDQIMSPLGSLHFA